jgi:hypothetical protein
VTAGATTQVSLSTIADNRATGGNAAGGYHYGLATGGGMSNQGMLQTRNTIVAGNTVGGPGTNTGPDLAGNLGSLGHNLISNSDGGSGFDPTDLLDVDPLLGPLQDNGGPTETMALLPGSPAIGAGDKTGHPRWDQRGRPYRRVVNHRMDIGALEVQSDSPGPSAPGNGRSEGPILVPRISALPLPTDASALCLVAPFRGSGATLSLERDVVPRQEVESDPKTAAVDQFFTSLEEQAQRPRPVRWPDLEPIKFGGLHPDLFREEVGLVL